VANERNRPSNSYVKKVEHRAVVGTTVASYLFGFESWLRGFS